MNPDHDAKLDAEIATFARDSGYEIKVVRDGARLDRVDTLYFYLEVFHPGPAKRTQLDLYAGAWLDFGTLRYSSRTLLNGRSKLSLPASDGALSKKLRELDAKISALSYSQLLNAPPATTLGYVNVAVEDWTPFIDECLANNTRRDVVQALDACGAFGARGQHALPKILPLAESTDVSILGHLAAALGFMGKSTPSILAVLNRLSFHPNKYVKAMAVQALDRLTMK